MTNLAESLISARSFLEILAIDLPESSSWNHSVFDQAYYDEIHGNLWRCLSERSHSSPYSERQRMARIIKTRLEIYDADGDVFIEVREFRAIMRKITWLGSGDEDAEFARLAKATDIAGYRHYLAEIRKGVLTFKKIIFLENGVAKRAKIAEIPDAELAKLAEIISREEKLDANIVISFSAFQMALIPFSKGLASVLHLFLLCLICTRPRENNWSPKKLYKDLQNIFKQANSEECADMWVFLINKKLKKNWKPKELYFNQQECADIDMWAAYFVGQVLRYHYRDYGRASDYDETRGVLNYCEKLKRSAMELQSNEYVVYSLVYPLYGLIRGSKFLEAQTMLQGIEKQLNQTESVYQEYFFRGMAMSLHARLIFHQKGNCEEATVTLERGLELLKLVLNDPVYYEPKTYINSPIAPPVLTLWLTKEWIKLNEKALSAAYCKDLPSPLVAPLELPSLHFVRGFANENPNQATAWANELLQKTYESVHDPSVDISSLEDAFDAYAEVIDVTCRDENGLLSGEALDKIEDVFNKLFPSFAFASSMKFIQLCWDARAYDKAYQCLLKNVQTLMEVGFDDNSEARMSHFENRKLIFRMLESTLFESGHMNDNMEDAKKAVVWCERSKGRDLAYTINNKYGRDTYQDDFCKFDVDDDHAWNEIQNICSLAGPHTAFLVFSKVFDEVIVGYFLCAVFEPFLFKEVLPENLPSDGLWNKFKNAKFLNDMYRCFISSWKRKMPMMNNHIIEKLVIVPCEEFSALPFAALYDRENKKYLIQSYAISYCPSLRLFQHCEFLRRKLLCGVPSPGLRALVVGNPTLDSAFLNLPFAEAEADIVAKALCDAHYDYDGIKLLKKEAATREEVLDGFSSYDWIHIACHAIVDAKHPRGAILLASAPNHPISSKSILEPDEIANQENLNASEVIPSECNSAIQEGGIFSYERAIREHLISSKSILEPHEIAKQEELKARGVILSACNSALGEICADGILGLCRSFHMSGVPTIVASLWKVNDEATKVLMEKYYKNLKTGMEMVVALQRAMQSMIEEEDECGCPRFIVDDWAPFIVSGTPFTNLCESSSEPH